MLQLMVVYYGIPLMKIGGYKVVLEPYTAATITFIINYAAYLVEIMRSGIESIDKGQHEAAKVLGYSYWQKIIYIILGILIAILIVVKHRSNIERLKNGTESKFSLKNKK